MRWWSRVAVVEMPAVARAAVAARLRRVVDELDYQRRLQELASAGFTQRQIASWLGIAQPSVLSALRTAARVPVLVAGFSGATPAEICQRYAAGLLSREQLVDELVRFPYAAAGRIDDVDGLVVDPAGAWSEVEDATHREWIEDDVYEEVFTRRHGPVDAVTWETAS